MVIQVTVEDIIQGKPLSYQGCPIALAVGKVLAPGVCVGITKRMINLVKGTEWIDAYPTLDTASKERYYKFIKAFDNKLPVSPFEFEMKAPEWYFK